MIIFLFQFREGGREIEAETQREKGWGDGDRDIETQGEGWGDGDRDIDTERRGGETEKEI